MKIFASASNRIIASKSEPIIPTSQGVLYKNSSVNKRRKNLLLRKFKLSRSRSFMSRGCDKCSSLRKETTGQMLKKCSQLQKGSSTSISTAASSASSKSGTDSSIKDQSIKRYFDFTDSQKEGTLTASYLLENIAIEEPFWLKNS